MKKILNARLCLLPLLLMIVALLPACKKMNDSSNAGAPSITSVRLYHPSPKDTLIGTGNLNADTSFTGHSGKYVVIIGHNLQNATNITFDGVPASFNTALFAPNSAVVSIPYIEFSKIDTAKLYTIQYTTPAGSTSFAFKLGPPAPTISAVSDVFAAPGDSVYLYGSNLVLVQQFSYGGTNIPKFNSNANGTSLGFLMPATTSNKLIIVTTKSGIARDTINAKPIIYSISNCNPELGDSVYVYGNYLKTISSITFGGATITNFTEGPHGAYVKFAAPDRYSYANGTVTIGTSYGTVSTVYQVNTADKVWDGLLADCWWGNYFGVNPWGSTVEALGYRDAAYDGPMGSNTHYGNDQFGILISPVLAGGASTYFPLGNSNPTANHPRNYWMPVANLTDPPSNWAFQFDISVPRPWNGGTLYISTEFAGDSYVARYEPWKIPGSNVTKSFKTKGWQTVIIPLSEFRSKVNELGDGVSITQISQLLGGTGTNSYNMTLKNFDTSPTATDFKVAIDNIRCVKIK
ncbi:glycan-binding surface protein [Mucilaginibacter sp. R-33]|uniref:glycan-binding surface protein n=1 Tax=Mucilaginibacter sp. R-33 TaxID=3416711 RepID=UPI003CEE77C0